MYTVMSIFFWLCTVLLWVNSCISSYFYLRFHSRKRKLLYAGTGLVAPVFFIVLFALMLRALVPEAGSSITLDDVSPDFTTAAGYYAVCVALWSGTWFIIRYCSAHKGRILGAARG